MPLTYCSQCPELVHISEDEYFSSRSSTITPVFAPPCSSVRKWNGNKDFFPRRENVLSTEWDNAKRRFLDDLSNYIPVGSFVASCPRSPPGEGEELEQWSDETWTESERPIYELDQTSPKYGFIFSMLLSHGWARLFVKVHKDNPKLFTIRVYILPDDVGRRYIDRNLPTKDPERKYLMDLMLSLDISDEAWKGDMVREQYQPLRTINDPRSNDIHDEGSLFYLFNTITSPDPKFSRVQCPYSREAVSSLLGDSSELDGLRTSLYPYQRRSAATMIMREAEPARILDPRLEPFEGPEGRTFYYDKETGVLLRDKRTYEEARGGVLAETMGHGKTLICLAAILATKGHWPRVPPEYSIGRNPIRPKVGTLAEMAAAAIGRNQIPWRAYFQDLSKAGEHHETIISLLEENIGSYVVPPPPSGRTRHQPSVKGQTIQLCTATLVVVPLNLFTQWQSEMALHIEPGAQKILLVQALDTLMPSKNEILTCDVLLISKQRLEREMKPLEINATTKKTVKCVCSSVRDCNCAAAGPNYHSPLRNLHFLRIIVDEGHDFASSGGTNNAIWALRRLHVDRRWIVSGTPSVGLLGVEVGLAANETSSNTASNDMSADLEAQNRESVRISKETVLIRKQVSRIPDQVERELTLRTQASTRLQEYRDLQKLGRIVVDFLGLRPWANTRGEDLASWQKYILPTKDGTRKPRSLKSILESLVVRHRIEDVERDIKLPPLHNRVVYLEPSWHDKLSINLFLLVLTANAVTSERCDQDYMFHPKNRPQLNTLINNLRQSGFYWTSFTPENIAKTVEVSQKYLDEGLRRPKYDSGRKDNDVELLQHAIKVGQTALESSSWSSIALLHELGLFVEDFPAEACESWSLVRSGFFEPLLVGASQLARAQQFVDSQLHASHPEKGLQDEGKILMQSAWLKVAGHGQPGNNAEGELPDRLKEPEVQRQYGYQQDLKLLSKHTVSKGKKASISPRKRAQKLRTLPKSTSGEEESNGKHLKSILKAPTNVQPLMESRLMKTRLCGTASSKLSYLIDRILQLQADEKSLIFFEGDNIAYYIAQAFELVDIRFLIYTGSLTTSRKNAYIHTFNTTKTFRVMLMDVRQAAHGLHIASASRVFFVNPVWQPNVEAQAIKRAHRIGQARPVFVETLVLKDTLEHQMLQRRKTMTAPEHFDAEKSLLDDPIMSDLIKDAKFIPFTDQEVKDPRYQMAPLQHPQQLFGRLGNGIGSVDDADAGLIFPDGRDLELTQRKQLQSDESFEFAPDITLSPLSRKRRELNLHNDGDYLSPTKHCAMDFLSGLPESGSPSGFQAPPVSASPMTRAPGPSLGVSGSRRKRVAFAADEDDNDGPDSPAPPSKRVACSTDAPASLFGNGKAI